MRSEQRTVYVADDGQEFSSESACIAHENVEAISSYLGRATHIYWRDTDPHEVARAIAVGFVVLRRTEATEILYQLGDVEALLLELGDRPNTLETVQGIATTLRHRLA